MKYTIENLINSPYDVITTDGPQRIPARGELTAEFEERSLAIMRQMGYFQITEAGEEKPSEPAAQEPAKRGPGRPKKDA